jgi:hypothetical protein
MNTNFFGGLGFIGTHLCGFLAQPYVGYGIDHLHNEFRNYSHE